MDSQRLTATITLRAGNASITLMAQSLERGPVVRMRAGSPRSNVALYGPRASSPANGASRGFTRRIHLDLSRSQAPCRGYVRFSLIRNFAFRAAAQDHALRPARLLRWRRARYRRR
jgi:hypothetical protein